MDAATSVVALLFVWSFFTLAQLGARWLAQWAFAGARWLWQWVFGIFAAIVLAAKARRGAGTAGFCRDGVVAKGN